MGYLRQSKGAEEYLNYETVDGVEVFKKPTLLIYHLPSIFQREISRSYTSFIDTIGNIGGNLDIFAMFFGFFYMFYYEKEFERDVIHKSCLISGKYS